MRSRIPIRIGISGLVVILLVPISLYKVPTTFNMSVTTQILEVDISSKHRAQWYFRDATVLFGHNNKEKKSFTGRLLILPHTHASFERIGSGPLELTCTSQKPGETVAELFASEGATPLRVKDKLVLVDHAPVKYASESYATVLPMSGLLSLGAEVMDDMGNRPALLLGGKITLIAKTLIGELRYDAGEVFLEMGDKLSLDQHGDAYGLVVVRQEPQLLAIFRVIGKRIDVYRYGTQGYTVYASPLTRIKKDHVLQAIWGAALFLLAIIAKWPKKENRRQSP